MNGMDAWIRQHGRGHVGPKPRPMDAPQAALIDVEASTLTRGARRDQLVAAMPAEWRERQRAVRVQQQHRCGNHTDCAKDAACRIPTWRSPSKMVGVRA